MHRTPRDVQEHPLHPSPAGKESPTLYVSFPLLHPQVGQHSSSPAGTTTPPGKLQGVGAQSTSAQSVAFMHTCPQPLEQHFIPGPQSAPTGHSSTHIPNPVGLGHTNFGKHALSVQATSPFSEQVHVLHPSVEGKESPGR